MSVPGSAVRPWFLQRGLRKACRAETAPLADEGRVQSILRPGNARGNALSTNAAQPRVLPVSQYTWTDDGSAVAVRVPQAPLAGTGAPGKEAASATQRVRASFAPRSFELEVLNDGGVPYQLRVSQLPGSLDPEASATLGALSRRRD